MLILSNFLHSRRYRFSFPEFLFPSGFPLPDIPRVFIIEENKAYKWEVFTMILKNCFPGGRSKAVTFSFDDGVRQDLRLMEIFRTYGIHATFNLNSGLFDGDHSWNYRGVTVSRLSRKEVEKSYQDFEIAVHTSHHPSLPLMSREGIVDEVLNDRRTLEEIAGYPVRGMAYPYGTWNREVVDVLASLGICYSRTVQSTHGFGFPEDYLAWHPTCHYMEPEVPELIDRFLSADPGALSLFYLWGHSYELDGNDNWDLIETFCQKFGNDDGVWKATNMELWLYMQALDRLVISCDQKTVFNPSALDVWITADGQTVKIPGGSTVNLKDPVACPVR